jgi:hypothetical protein
MIAHKDLNAIAGSTDAYTVSATGSNTWITAIGLDSGKKFVELGYLRDTASFTAEGTVDPTRGVAFSTNTLVFKLGDLSLENQTFLESVLTQPVAAIIKLRNGKYYALGLPGLFQLSAFTATSGAGAADEVSYSLTFNEIDGILPRQVDPSIISTLIA